MGNTDTPPSASTPSGDGPLRRRVSVFGRITSPASLIADLAVGEVLMRISNGTYREAVARVRTAESEGEAAAAKRALRHFTPSGVFTHRSRAGLVRHSGLVVLDYDGVRDPAAVKADLAHSPHVLAAFISPSDGGVKALVLVEIVDVQTGEARTPTGQAEHKAAFAAAATALALEGLDETGSDVSRACFVSHDPDLFVNADAVPLEVNPAAAPAPRSASEPRVEHAPRAVSDIIPAGRRHTYLVSLAGTLRRRGLNEEEILVALAKPNERCVPPLQEAELRTIAASMMSYAPEDVTDGAVTKTEKRLRAMHTAENGTLGVRLSDVKQERVKWVWPRCLAVGKITILDGDPGLGKSLVYLDIAARLTMGHPFPFEEGAPVRDPAGVVIVTTEDDAGDTIAPRAAAAGADLSRISVVSLIAQLEGPGRVPVLPDDVEVLMAACVEVGARLLIIDPLMAVLGERTNSYRDQDVRRALAPLAEAAARYGVAVLVVRHLNKSPGGNPLYRGGGSIGIIAAARIGLMLGRDPDQGGRLVLATMKNNLSAPAPALSLSVVPWKGDEAVPIIDWHGRSHLTAAELCAVPDRRVSKQKAAEEWLLEALEKGPRSAEEVVAAGEQAGHSKRTLDRAKAELGIESEKLAFDGGWQWLLPEILRGPGYAKGANSENGTLRADRDPAGE